MKALQHLNKYFFKYRFSLLVGIVITITANVFKLLVPPLLGDSIRGLEFFFNENTSHSTIKAHLITNALYILGAAIATGFFTFLMRQTIINVSRFVEFDLKNEIYKHYQILSLSFYKANRTGDLMNRISEDVGKVRMYIGPALMYALNTLTLFSLVIYKMYEASPTLTLYTLLPLPILSFLIYKISRIINKRSTVVQESLSKLSTNAQEVFSGISVIKSYNIEHKVSATFNTLALHSRQKYIDLSKIQALFLPMMILLIGLSNLIVIYFGGIQYIEGKVDFGTITEFIIYVNMLTWPVATVGWVTDLIQQAEASQKRINEFLKTEPKIKNYTEAITPISKGGIAFEAVNFTYPDTNIQALKSISFSIAPGKTLAILGTTGSGKSTILDLIGRLYDVSDGAITIDGTSIEKLNLYTLRKTIGFVPQDAFLFSDTIKNNITFGNENATEHDVVKASKQACVHDNIIKFNKGYNTILGERGITLSGGQKQRVSIARAIIKSPQILLFDDCLSAVDTETEEQILQNLSTFTKNKTTVVVTHRISSSKHADYIIVLDKGKIVQRGTHQTLIASEGYYKDLYNKQRSEKEMF